MFVFVVLVGGIFVSFFYIFFKGGVLVYLMWCVVLIGLSMRLVYFGLILIYEDDWYWYFWDGVVIDVGVSFYKFFFSVVVFEDGYGNVCV